MSRNPTYKLEEAIINASARLYELMDGKILPDEALSEILADDAVIVDPDKLDKTDEGRELFIKWTGMVTERVIVVQSVDPEE